MEIYGIDNSFNASSYSTQATHGNYANTRFPVIPSNNTNCCIKAPDLDFNFISETLDNKINDFQAVASLLGPLDSDLDDLRNIITTISYLKENLTMYNLGDTLRELKSIGSDNYAMRQRVLNMQELRENEQSVAIRSYMYSLYDKVYEKKIQSMGLDVYY